MVSILGRPNAGKSTLLNALVGSKLAIVSSKPQTTRTSIQGVLTTPGAQVVFIDTPGIHRSTNLFSRRMMNAIRAAIESLDAALLLVDASLPFTAEDEEALALVKKCGAPALLLLNKIDRLENKRPLLPLLEKYQSLHDFAGYFPVSAKTGDGLDVFRRELVKLLPEGPPLYPKDYITDQPERYLASELIREMLLRHTRDEVPHAVAVVVEKWEDASRLLRIHAAVYVEKEGQKAIVIGARGAGLKQTGTLARQELEAFFGKKVFLALFVKVVPGWRKNPRFLNEIDWRGMAGTEP